MGSMEGISFNEQGLAHVKASSFIAMIEDITTQIHMLSGLHETYGDTDIVNPDDAYKPVRYALTD